MAADGDKMQVAFEKAGEKHVLASFLVAAERAADIPF
jgi:DNA helicase-2/ATP-dependent DNA helicase PcrA